MEEKVEQSNREMKMVMDSVRVYDRDSIVVMTKGDTVYLTKIGYREREHLRWVHDTIRIVQRSVERVVSRPSEAKAKSWGRWWQWMLCGVAVGLIVVVLIRRVI